MRQRVEEEDLEGGEGVVVKERVGVKWEGGCCVDWDERRREEGWTVGRLCADEQGLRHLWVGGVTAVVRDWLVDCRDETGSDLLKEG